MVWQTRSGGMATRGGAIRTKLTHCIHRPRQSNPDQLIRLVCRVRLRSPVGLSLNTEPTAWRHYGVKSGMVNYRSGLRATLKRLRLLMTRISDYFEPLLHFYDCFSDLPAARDCRRNSTMMRHCPSSSTLHCRFSSDVRIQASFATCHPCKRH